MIDPSCTADLCDSAPDDVGIVDVTMRSFGGVASGDGPVRLVRLRDDNRFLFEVLDQPGDGHILVVKVESSLRPAVVGENVARRALDRGWGGILVDGAVRDVRILATMPLLVVAREARPFRLRTVVGGEFVDELTFGGVVVRTGDRAVVDDDGIVFTGARSA